MQPLEELCIRNWFLYILSGKERKTKTWICFIGYSIRLGNGAVFKRLGFLLELFSPDGKTIIEKCKSQLSKGNVKLDPKLGADKLVTRWKLWIPKNWVKEQ